RRHELICDGRHAPRTEAKADIEQPEVQATEENRNGCDRPELSTRGPLDEGNEQQGDREEAQSEEEKRRKLRNAHLDGHELIAPEQGNGHRADDLDDRHGILPFKTDRSKYRRARRRRRPCVVHPMKRLRRASAVACDVVRAGAVLPTTRSPSTKQTITRAA